MSRLYLLAANVYMRAFRDATFGAVLQEFVTGNVADFALIARHLDVAFVPPFPPSPAV